MAPLKPGENIWSGAFGLAGALTNMSAKAWANGRIKNNYPVRINDRVYEDSEAAYQAMKARTPSSWQEDYNDGLMVDIIALKFTQNRILASRVQQNGGVAWLEQCSHFTGARSPKFQAWEGQGRESRFIRNLIGGYEKATTGRSSRTRVVHVHEAPFDVYIGRQMADGLKFPQSVWHNPVKAEGAMSKDKALEWFNSYLHASPQLLEKLGQLKGKTLGCWCKHKENYDSCCHGDVLAALADGRTWEPKPEAQQSLF